MSSIRTRNTGFLILASPWGLVLLAVLSMAPMGVDAQEEERAQPIALAGSVNVSFASNPDASVYLERVLELSADERFAEAVAVLEKLLAMEEQPLVAEGGGVYVPNRRRVVRRLAADAPGILDAYRATVDPAARTIYGRDGEAKTVASLETIVRQYFLSGYGDDAAFRLACRALGQGEFPRAHSLLTRIGAEYPDPSLAAGERLRRLAVAAAGIGLHDEAVPAWEASRPTPSERTSEQNAATEAWLERTRRRTRSIRGAPPLANAPPLAEKHDTDAQTPLVCHWTKTQPLRGKRDRGQAEQVLSVIRRKWRPGVSTTDKLLVARDTLYVSSPSGIRCYTPSGDQRWEAGGADPLEALGVYESPFDNRFGRVFNRGGTSFIEWNVFAARMEGAIRIIGDTLVRLEGVRQADVQLGRTGTFLSAYDSDTGELQWRVGGGTPGGTSPLGGGRIRSLPVRCRDTLIIPVETDDRLRLVALDAVTGTVRWDILLCLYDAPLVAGETPMGLLSDGGMVYLATGQGVVFCVDGVNSLVQWAATYRREPVPRTRAFHYIKPADREVVTWEDNRVLLLGGRLLVLPADAPGTVISLNRADGSTVSKMAVEGASTLVGVDGERLFVAGPGFAQAVKPRTSETLWRRELAPTTGRGVLTDQGLLFPQGAAINVLSTKTGDHIGVIPVELPSAEVPLGNLAADRTHIYAAGLDTIFALARGRIRPERVGTIR